MSVWSNPCYKVDPLWKSIRLLPRTETRQLPSYLHFAAQGTVDNAGSENPELTGCTYRELFDNCPEKWRNFAFKAQTGRKIQSLEHARFANTLKNNPIKYAGIKSVYWIVARIWQEAWYFDEESEFEKHLSFSKTLANLSVYIDRTPAKKMFEDNEKMASLLKDDARFRYLINAKDSIDRFWTFRTLRSIQRRNRETKTINEGHAYVKVPRLFARLKVIPIPGGYILIDTKTSESGIVFWKDQERIITTLNAIGNLYMYFKLYNIDEELQSKTILSGYIKMMDEITAKMLSNTWDDCNKLCRALDVVCNMFIAFISDDISDRGYTDQVKKLQKENLDKVLDCNKIFNIAIMDGGGIMESLELLRVYKILPCPDFCHYSVMPNIEKKFAERNVFNMDQRLNNIHFAGKSVDLIISEEEFYNYCMRGKAYLYKNNTKSQFDEGRFPGKLKDPVTAPQELQGYPHIPETNLTVDNVHHIDFTGSFNYQTFDKIEHELVKDKKTANAWNARIPSRISENQVMQYLFDPNFLPQSKVIEAFTTMNIPWKKTMSIALKPEAKKPASRAFYMAPDPARRALSEFEYNISNYVRNKNGSSQGKNDMELDEKFDDITNWEELSYNRVMLSFDLESFSGGQDIKFKEIGIKQWAECFGCEWHNNLLDIFSDYKLRWERFDVEQESNLFGNDLEGFNGRLNTDIHLDVMGYCIYKCRQLGLLDMGGKMECLIDDGLLALQIKRKDFKRRLDGVLKVIEFVYNAAGLKISWDKTYVSSQTCQYLNRIFHRGQEITGGAKAFLRIGKLVEAPIPTIIDHLSAHAATTRGAIKAGADHRVAYFKYCMEVTNTIWKWSKYNRELEYNSNLGLTCFAPVGLGGLGISNLFSLSTNQTFDPYQHGLSNLKMIAHGMRETVPWINSRINAKMRQMSDFGTLAAPRSIRYEYRTINVRRFAKAARDVVLIKSVNPFVKLVAEQIKFTTGSVILDTYGQMQMVHDAVRVNMWEMDPLNAVDNIVGKLQNSSTAASLIGVRRALSIALINKKEAREMLKDSSKGVLRPNY